MIKTCNMHHLVIALIALIGLSGCDISETPEARELKKIDVPDFSEIKDSKTKKQAFFDYLYPLIRYANEEIEEERNKLRGLGHQTHAITSQDEKWVRSLCKSYKAKCEDSSDIKSAALTLSRRIGAVPPSMALAQAANESAWGTSRFAINGHNYFGQWCYSKGCGFIPASRNANATHEVREFDHPLDSVRSYVHNISTSPAYEHLRELRSKARSENQRINGWYLAQGLINYSERREEYIKEVRHMIKGNNLERYDNRKAVREEEANEDD